MSGPYSKRKRYEHDVEAWVQFRLLRLAAHHAETTKADLAVLAEVIQRYWGKFGNGFVSDREISGLAGLTERTVRRARKNLVRLGFVQVVRAGGRGHATVYTPNFSLVPPKADIPVLDKKEDIPVFKADENVRLNGALQDENVLPSYLLSGLQTGPQIDRLDRAAPDAGLAAAPAAQEGLSLNALLAAYAPADMSKPARAAYKRAWEAIPAGTDLGMVIDAAADWHQAWAQQNNPDAPRMGLVRWIRDETYLKPAPRGFTKVERKAKPKPATTPAGTTTITIARADVIRGATRTELHLAGDGFERAIVVESEKDAEETAGRAALKQIVEAAGIGPISDASELVGKRVNVVRLSGGVVEFTRPDPLAEDAPPAVHSAAAEPAPRPAEPDPTPAPRAKKVKPKIRRREMTRDEEREWLRAKIADGLFRDGVA